jgi:CyaY protein
MDPGSDRDASFLQRVDSLLRELVLRMDHFDPDELEAETSEGVLKLTFGDGTKCILNRQSAARQLWLAEGASAWHFEFDPTSGSWRDTKGRGELRPILAELLTRRLGRTVSLG